MTVDQNKVNQAVHEMALATIPPEEWAHRIEHGYQGEPYNYPATHNYKAMQLLYDAVHSSSTTPPPPPDPRTQRVVFCAQEPQTATSAPNKYCAALSADMAYRDASVAAIPYLRPGGRRVAGWCDCDPAKGTSAEKGMEFVSEYGLDYFIGQAESPEQFDDALSVGAVVMVGNITGLRQDQIDKIALGQVFFIQEDYWNEGWQRAENPAISAYCAGVYETPLWGEGGPKIQDYKNAGRWRDGDGVYHAAAVQDWGSLT